MRKCIGKFFVNSTYLWVFSPTANPGDMYQHLWVCHMFFLNPKPHPQESLNHLYLFMAIPLTFLGAPWFIVNKIRASKTLFEQLTDYGRKVFKACYSSSPRGVTDHSGRNGIKQQPSYYALWFCGSGFGLCSVGRAYQCSTESGALAEYPRTAVGCNQLKASFLPCLQLTEKLGSPGTITWLLCELGLLTASWLRFQEGSSERTLGEGVLYKTQMQSVASIP